MADILTPPSGDIAAIGGLRHTLTHHPLGMVGLFIMLVYGIGGVVTGFANPAFYSNPHHPAVIFLALFPALILIAFVILVALSHRTPRTPQAPQAEPVAMKVAIDPANVPSAVASGLLRAATTKTVDGEIDRTVRDRLGQLYQREVDFGYCLLHEVTVLRDSKPGLLGTFRVRVWVEAIDRRRTDLRPVAHVTYRVGPNFPVTTFCSQDKASQFDLWLTAYGECPVLAEVKLADGDVVILRRFVDLPGRPLD